MVTPAPQSHVVRLGDMPEAWVGGSQYKAKPRQKLKKTGGGCTRVLAENT
jgi:hypothetical protein